MAENFWLKHVGDKPSVESIKDILVIKSDITVIGRNKQSADLFLDSSKYTALISRMHARIIRTLKSNNEYQYEIYDTSLNGTYVNDIKISGSVVLKDGDTIVFGHLQGAVIDPGEYAPQKNSEFIYRFEKITEDHKKNDQKKDAMPPPRISKFSSPKTPAQQPAESKSRGNISDRLISLPLYENTPTNEDLCNLANEVTSRLVEDSEEEFSLNPLPLHDTSSSSTSPCSTSPRPKKSKIQSSLLSESNEETPVLSTTRLGTQKRKITLEKENWAGISSNVRSLKECKARKTPGSGENKTYSHDVCASLNCKHPKGVKNTWVQCDDCDNWFHLKCAGLTAKKAKAINTAFHCGC